MRKLLVRLLLAAAIFAVLATPVAAQVTQFELDQLRAQQQAAERRAVAQSNELMALEARLRADQAVAELRAPTARAPELLYDEPPARGSALATAKFPAMSDAALAESNRRVREAAQNRR
jgi:hypothetical protein